jgi:hypothetical protein
MEFDGENVTITHEGYFAKAAHGPECHKVIPIASVNEVCFQPAGLLRPGFIQISVEGETSGYQLQPGLPILQRNMLLAADANAILFPYRANHDFDDIAAVIGAAISDE